MTGPDEFMAIVDRHEPRLRRLVHRLVLDPHRLDDVMQDVFLRAYRALPRWRGDGDIGTWLYRIAYNTAIDEIRRRRTHVHAVPDDEPDPRSADDLARVEHLAWLEDALARLTPEQRAVVVLVDVDGFDYATAGSILGIAEGTVSSRVSRARASLRAELTKEDVR